MVLVHFTGSIESGYRQVTSAEFPSKADGFRLYLLKCLGILTPSDQFWTHDSVGHIGVPCDIYLE
jgi:hypothetical protein